MINQLNKILLLLSILCCSDLIADTKKSASKIKKTFPVLFLNPQEIYDQCLPYKEWFLQLSNKSKSHNEHCNECKKRLGTLCGDDVIRFNSYKDACDWCPSLADEIKLLIDEYNSWKGILKQTIKDISESHSACYVMHIYSANYDYEMGYYNHECDITNEVIYRINKQHIDSMALINEKRKIHS